MEAITIKTKDGYRYGIKAEVKDISDHLLRFVIQEDRDELYDKKEQAAKEQSYWTRKIKVGDLVLRFMDKGCWRLVIVEIIERTDVETSNPDVDSIRYFVEILAEISD